MAITLSNITSGYNTALINANFQKVEDYINDVLLARAETGVAGEAKMERDLDMDGYKILNANIGGIDLDSLSLAIQSAVRVPLGEAPIDPLVPAAQRAGKMLGFSPIDGKPTVLVPASGSAADVLMQLASTSGWTMIGTSSGINLAQYLARSFIYLDDIVPSTNGSLDCAPAINAALATYSGKGVTLIGSSTSVYKVESTIDFTGKTRLTLNFNGATVLDNVQGTIPASANRANHTFLVYNASDIKITNITYDVAPTRANTPGVPTCVFWVGGQYLGSAMTRNVVLGGFRTVTGKFIDGGIVVAGLGELDGLKVSNFFIDGGNWGFGCNFEYGDRPVDLATDFTMNNGKHPYNITVDNFSGQNLLVCQGFLRTASCYNIEFRNCVGYNIRNFFYGYGGDRNISRFSQNVRVINCKSKINPSILNTAFYAVNVIIVNKDGSTGDPLPSWTNYDHTFVFESCEFMHNQTSFSSCVRVGGTQGSATFRNCIFERGYYGIWAGPSSNPDYVMETVLHVEDCVFKDNIRDVNLDQVNGAVFSKCKFKPQSASSVQNPFALATSPRTKIINCYFGTPSGDRPSILSDAASVNCVLQGNYFELFNTTSGYAVSLSSRAYGYGNRTNGTAQVSLTQSASTSYGIRGEDSTMIRDAVLFNGTGVLNADIGNFYTSANTTGIVAIVGGVSGDEVVIRGIAVGSSVTFTHASAGASATDRLIMKGNANRTETGNSWSVRFRKVPGAGWYEL